MSFKKNQIKFNNPFDFNVISNLLSNGNFESCIKSRWLPNYVLDSTFHISKIQNTNPTFVELYNNLNKKYNLKKFKSDLDLFFSFIPGTRCNYHSDGYSIYIIGALGRTLYKVKDKEYVVSPGDILHIPAFSPRISISLDPRIILSFGVYDVI